MGGGFGSFLYMVGFCLFLLYGLFFFGLVLLWLVVDFFCGCDEYLIFSNDVLLLFMEDFDEIVDESGVIVREVSEDVRVVMFVFFFEIDNNFLFVFVELLFVRGFVFIKIVLVSLILYRNFKEF